MTVEIFWHHYRSLKEEFISGYEWVEQNEPNHWCNALFKGEQFGEMYSNIVESFNARTKEAHHLPNTQLVDSIRFKIMQMMYDRRKLDEMWETYLCPTIHEKKKSNNSGMWKFHNWTLRW